MGAKCECHNSLDRENNETLMVFPIIPHLVIFQRAFPSGKGSAI